ncbi:MAG: hypothetical protein OEY74_09750, partial [Gammaproteobacteria bacterium]|nr:hypothetical protein [Gammaproteobacteria bacterium]
MEEYLRESIENVLPWLSASARSNNRACLATLVFADGSSPRPRGSQMIVAEDGSFWGYLSGGCVEAAIATVATTAITTGKNFATRFGVGSPFLDIRLPCGAGIDIWFDHTITTALVDNVLQRLAHREPVCVETCVDPLAGTPRIISPDIAAKPTSFRRWYYPNRRIYIVGTGPSVLALARLAEASNYEVTVLSPDGRTLDDLSSLAVRVKRLTDISQIQALDRDQFTALVLLFHEHERETEIL